MYSFICWNAKRKKSNSTLNKQIITTSNNLVNSHNHNVKKQKPGKKEHKLVLQCIWTSKWDKVMHSAGSQDSSSLWNWSTFGVWGMWAGWDMGGTCEIPSLISGALYMVMFTLLKIFELYNCDLWHLVHTVFQWNVNSKKTEILY